MGITPGIELSSTDEENQPHLCGNYSSERSAFHIGNVSTPLTWGYSGKRKTIRDEEQLAPC